MGADFYGRQRRERRWNPKRGLNAKVAKDRKMI
jgi:hypothetical protein